MPATVIVTASLAMLRSGTIVNRATAASVKSIQNMAAEVRRAEADLRAGRNDEALARLQRIVGDVDNNVVTAMPAGSA